MVIYIYIFDVYNEETRWILTYFYYCLYFYNY
jgi:hypothetical protein